MASRIPLLAAAGVLVLAACGPAGDAGSPSDATLDAPPGAADLADGASDDDPASVEPIEVDQVESSPRAVTESALAAWRDQIVPDAFPDPLVDLAAIRSGGPPPDGIPPIDAPRFLRPGDVDFLADGEPVLALVIDDDHRAYPVQILTWHEIVNDTVAGIPVSVTYCPLCNSAIAYDRRVGERVLDFGTSGLLWNSALVMYDRQTESLWSHFTGQAVFGELTGEELDAIPLATVAWETWRDAHPDGLVLSRDTGFERQYGRNPYPGYDDVDGVPFLFEGEVDGRFTAMTRIVGVELDGEALGVPLVTLRERGIIDTELAGDDLVVWWVEGVASALDRSTIAEGADVGATGVFVPEADGMTLTFTSDGSTFVDDQTGTRWNVLGEAVEGPLAGTRLEPVGHVDTFWFAWSTFRPDTALVAMS